MNTHSLEGQISALAPVPEGLDEEWAEATLARILADAPQPRRRDRRRLALVAAAGVLTISSGTAVAAANMGSIGVVRDVLVRFGQQPNTTGNNIGTLGTPQLVTQFRRGDGRLFALWIATSSKGAICTAYSDGSWDGDGAPTAKQLEYGCGGEVVDPTKVDTPIPLERPDQVGGFFKDEAEPILYGVSPYADAVEVRVQGNGVDRTLPLRSDSHGFGAALPEATGADSLRLTFLDAAGQPLGSRTYIAPVG